MSSVVRDISDRVRGEEERVAAAETRARVDELTRARERIVSVQEGLRREIAQQLHGSVQNGIVVVLFQLSQLERTASGGLKDTLSNLHSQLTSVLDDDIRGVSRRLYPSILRQGLGPALQSLRDSLESAQTIHLDIDAKLSSAEREDRDHIPEPVRLGIYRIAEEALTHVVKHAEAGTVRVSIQLDDERELTLRVQDDGKGMDPTAIADSVGMATMTDNSEVVGGHCRLPAPGAKEPSSKLSSLSADLHLRLPRHSQSAPTSSGSGLRGRGRFLVGLLFRGCRA